MDTIIRIPDSVSKFENVYDVLNERGMIDGVTDEAGVRDLLGREKIKFYIGLILQQTAFMSDISFR